MYEYYIADCIKSFGKKIFDSKNRFILRYLFEKEDIFKILHISE